MNFLSIVTALCFTLGQFASHHNETRQEAWSDSEIEKANTAKDVTYLTQVEKDVILYVNLARLYPKKFNRIEVTGYYGPPEYYNYLKGSKYITSLKRHLNKMSPMNVVVPSDGMNINAKCFAKESGDSGYMGHQRKKCPKRNYAECCSYGMKTGKDIVLQWLIDHDVPSLGHRVNCLNKSYTKVGVGFAPHVLHKYCCVLELA